MFITTEGHAILNVDQIKAIRYRVEDESYSIIAWYNKDEYINIISFKTQAEAVKCLKVIFDILTKRMSSCTADEIRLRTSLIMPHNKETSDATQTIPNRPD